MQTNNNKQRARIMLAFEFVHLFALFLVFLFAVQRDEMSVELVALLFAVLLVLDAIILFVAHSFKRS